MRDRCRNPNNRDYKNYGGRGIKVCDRWNDFRSFAIDMGPRPAGFSLERKDNDGPYCPENCIWASKKEQNGNKRNILRVAGQSLSAYCETHNKNYGTVKSRVLRGWDIERAVFAPPKAPKITASAKADLIQKRKDGAKVYDLARQFGISPAFASLVSRGMA